MKDIPTIDDLDVEGRTVLVRGDLNVPMVGGRLTNGLRIDRLVPTIQELRAGGARVVLLSHFGRPRGAPRFGLFIAAGRRFCERRAWRACRVRRRLHR